MSRYNNTRKKINKKGKRVFRPTMYPKIPMKDSDIFIYPKFGDRLDTLAQKYYQDVSLWWIIAKANNLDQAHIGLETDKQLRIPMDITPAINRLKNMSY
tara:strand:- start:4089 stop:4385 length:297 start_codon:yes stop_codon:yes gene_type:complete